MSENVNIFLENASTFRLGAFLVVFVFFLVFENVCPFQKVHTPQLQRRITNLILVFLSSLLVRLVLPITVLAMAVVARDNGWGLLNYLKIDFFVALILSVVFFDVSIYWQHRVFHLVPFLWAFHRVHHADRGVDVTTGVRFHPIEMVLSVLFKLALVLLLGASPEAVLLFEIVLNLSAMFSHSNIRISPRLEPMIRTLFVTPDMHRIHHSVSEAEMNNNFGFCLSLWDKVFRSYQQSPRGDKNNMVLGLSAYQDTQPIKLWWCLTLPFKR